METNIPEDLKNSDYSKPPYNQWEINPKHKVPHVGPYIYVRPDGSIRPMTGSIAHLRAENRLEELEQ